MNFVYTNHAKENLVERKIKKEDVEQAILNPDEIFKGKKDRNISHKFIGNKLLRVIYKKEEKVYIVITAYYTKVGRYKK